MPNILKFSEFINEDFKHFGWTDQDERMFNDAVLKKNKWTSFSWAVVKPVDRNGVPDILVDINGEIYDSLVDITPKYAHRGYGKSVLSETYARNVTINVRPGRKTAYSEYREGKTYKLVKAKVLGKDKCEIYGIDEKGEELYFRYMWK